MTRYIIFFTFLIFVCSCKPQREVVTEYVYTMNTDTLRQTQWRADSVIIRDSVFTLIKGDTVEITRHHTAYRERLRIDTVTEYKRVVEIQDREVETVKEVNRLKWWQGALMWAGAICIGLGVLMLCNKLFKR